MNDTAKTAKPRAKASAKPRTSTAAAGAKKSPPTEAPKSSALQAAAEAPPPPPPSTAGAASIGAGFPPAAALEVLSPEQRAALETLSL
ncbi:MAG: hypothetical protein JWP28_2154, partial [Phenylobacterium sp.]|nr:hypothetical protein [Phenylobacterium sp.]